MVIYKINISETVPLECQIPFDDVMVSRTTIVSPNYPRHYGNNMDCRLTMNVASDKSVVLQFETFRLQDSFDCFYDYFEVRDGNSIGSDRIGSRLCGTSRVR